MAHKLTKGQIDILAEDACVKAAQRMTGVVPAVTFTSQILTHGERVKIGRRLLIAQAILHGKTRMEINNHLHVSPNTYTQIRKWLESEFPEYRPSRTKEKGVKSRKHIARNQYIEPFTFIYLKRKYPAHFLLFNIVDEIFKP